ncbi:MAG: response regulator transcription factor [Anaerolineae bacterium]|nr:response regulator transcription factor [Anaerolineae bacterium]MCA9895614.1 response regulator transcription factor [Anaerolineae bacterium]MCB9459729.1 response regulator transcription factor [Anaerolineaceae bacterium]
MTTAQMVVLVVDDERPLRDFVRRNLDIRGYQVRMAGNGLEALAEFRQSNIDLVVLDLMMPHMDGLETIRRIRQTSDVPIIVLSAMDEEDDKIRALQLGADDYLTKPFGVGELLARIDAVMRRAQWRPWTSTTTSRLIHDRLTVDLERHQVLLNNDPLELTPIEFELLVYLMENAGKVLTHRAILQHVWGEEYGQESEYLRVYIGRLRQKIEDDPAHPRYLVTERGVGYLFNA